MEPDTYDWSEGQIRDLVAQNHVPVEHVVDGASTFDCLKCGEVWPCSMLHSLRDWVISVGGSANDMCPRCGLVTDRRPRVALPRPDPIRESKV